MNWITVWWQQIRGHIPPDPWEHDPEIVAARREQHRRIDKATELLAREGLALRHERQFWERFGLPRTKQHDDG